jgi:cellulose synthase/poly-beta-1,6-N-acetylglucosamine synthase-like glycosyltransferase
MNPSITAAWAPVELMLAVFWCASAFVVYTLAGYPISLWLLSRLRKRQHLMLDISPRLSVIIVAHNEAAAIADKVRNTLTLDYPRDKLEILVGSDGSTDATPQIVLSFSSQGVKLVESGERVGKHAIQMMARDAASGEILVFTDASISLEPEVLRKVASHFADPAVGCVSSVDAIQEGKKDWRGEAFYVYGEMGLRHLEARVGSLVSLNGSLFAVRREVAEAWHPDMSSDFFLALHAAERGYRSVIAPECRAGLRTVKSQKAEEIRKVRTIVHGLVVFFSHLHLLNVFRYGLFSWELASHKLFRWLLPFALLAILVSNAFLWDRGRFYRFTLAAQLAGYALGLLAPAVGRSEKLGVFKLAGFFLMGNVATLAAWWKFTRGEKLVVWEPSRRG